MDFILNGQGHGDVAARLATTGFDVGALRPWLGKDNRSYVTINRGGKPTNVPLTNATATLRKDDWKILDDAIVKAAKERLKAVMDLRSRGLTYSIPNGMGKTVLETETQSDISAAEVSMDGLRESKADRPLFELTNLPLPIVHKDFYFSARQVMASRNGGSPLDTTTAELAARRVSEYVEKMLIGAVSSYAYGGGTIYGYTNYTNRITRTITTPGTMATTLDDVLNMRQDSIDAYHYGPWILYAGSSWTPYLDDDFNTNYPNLTLRERLKKIEGIVDVVTLDYLTTGTDLVLVQLSSNVARMVEGLPITTVQWETKGGMQLNFKVMTIAVPQIRADQNSNTGIVHGSV